MLFMVLEKATDLTKPQLLAKILVGYMEDVINREDALALIHVVDVAFILDLKKFIKNEGTHYLTEDIDPWVDRLVGVGIYLEVQKGAPVGGNVIIKKNITPLGHRLLDACLNRVKASSAP